MSTLAVDGIGVTIDGATDEVPWTIDGGEPWAALLRARGAGRVDLGIRAEHVRPSFTGGLPWHARGLVRRLEPRQEIHAHNVSRNSS